MLPRSDKNVAISATRELDIFLKLLKSKEKQILNFGILYIDKSAER